MLELVDFFQLVSVSVLVNSLELVVFMVGLTDGVLEESNGVFVLIELIFKVLNLHLSLLENSQLVLQLLYPYALIIRGSLKLLSFQLVLHGL